VGRKRWSRPRASTRLATTGLAAVLVLLTGFSLWAAYSTNRAARQTDRLSRLGDAYQQAHFAVAAEQSHERDYRLEPGPEARASFQQATASLLDALEVVRQHGDGGDRALVKEVLADHDRYLEVIGRLFAAIDAGDTMRAEAIDEGEEDPLFDEIQEHVDTAADTRHQQALAALAALRRTGTTVLVTTPIAFAAGLGLLGVLVQVGQRLQASLRAVDTVARLGGDEFAVLLPQIATAEGAVTVAGKLQAVLAEPFLVEGLTLDVEASVGLALYPEHGNDPEELLQHADIAMYVAKDTHDGFVLFDPTQDQHSPRRLALLGELRRAIDQHQLLLHYQPKVDAHTGQVLGVEALVRWQHPSHGLIPPDEFIPLAERTGLIGPLTHYVLDHALRQCHQWQQAGHELVVAVNVSARRLLDLAFPEEVAALLARWEVPARLLVVEITESAIMADPAHAMEILGRLNAMGVQLAIDDFGTGYSSMAYLKSLPVHELKVDRSFVSQMTSSIRDAVIVRSTVDLGRNLGLRVVAEGVEDQATWQELNTLGCDAIQGYYISRPVSADELASWLAQERTATPNPQLHH
jgi:predicted signal transduction protein with EAL and GGDEF domain